MGEEEFPKPEEQLAEAALHEAGASEPQHIEVSDDTQQPPDENKSDKVQEHAQGDIYQDETGRWIRFNGWQTAEDGTEIPDESDVTKLVEQKGLEKVKESSSWGDKMYDSKQLQPAGYDDYAIGKDWADRSVGVRRLSPDEARMQANLLQMDKSERKTGEDGHEYRTGMGPFGHTGFEERFMENMDRRAKYTQLHAEVDPQMAEIEAEKDEIRKRWQDEHGPDSYGFAHGERYQELEDTRRELENRRPEGESGYLRRDKEEDNLRAALDKRAEFVNQQVHEIYNLNSERFAAMPAAEFLEVVKEYNQLTQTASEARNVQRSVNWTLERVQKAFDGERQFTAIEIGDYFSQDVGGHTALLASGKRQLQEASTHKDEIIGGFFDRTPRETYRMMLELGQKLKAVYEADQKHVQDEIDKLVAGQDVAEKPESGEEPTQG